MHLFWENMSWHGSGRTPLYQIMLTIGRHGFRLSWGGYGYVARPCGSWSVLPRAKWYRGTAYHLNWFAGSISYLPNAFRSATIGAHRVF